MKEVSNCLNDVMLEVSATMKDGETDANKLKRVIERNLNQCTSMVKRQLKQCKVSIIENVFLTTVFLLSFVLVIDGYHWYNNVIRKTVLLELDLVIVAGLILSTRSSINWKTGKKSSLPVRKETKERETISEMKLLHICKCSH